MAAPPTPGRIALLSLGCAKNLVDSEGLVGALRAGGFTLAERIEEADLALVNTCGFITPAKEESIETILKVAARKEYGRLRGLIVAGCLVERYLADLRREIPEVDCWLPFSDYPRVVAAARDLMGLPQVPAAPPAPRHLLTPAAYAYLKVSEGCDQRCAFCAIPGIRGRMKSRPIEDLRAEAERIAEHGVGEILVVSQDTTAYGRDVYGRPRLVDLLRTLTQVPGPRWWRLLYLYPSILRDDLLEEMAQNERIVKYVDLPLQHLADGVLRRMRRGISGYRQRSLLERIRHTIPGVTVRTTLIAGFPGETEADHRESLAAVAAGSFDRLGVFCFSPEEGTAAESLPDRVPQEIAGRRRSELMEAQRGVHRAANQRLIGQEVEVLIESYEPHRREARGRTPRDAPEVDGTVCIRGVLQARPGSFVRARVVTATDYDLVADALAPLGNS